MRLYSMPSSGNSYKLRLLLALLDRECELIDVEAGSHALQRARDEGWLPFGKAPALVTDGGEVLAESNAILCYLGEGTQFWPGDRVARAQMLGWMFWEQYSHEPVIAVRQSLVSYPHRAAEATPERLADLLDRGHALLGRIDRHLARQDWLAGGEASVADLCLYAYTHSAGARGGFEMARFRHVAAWLDRVAALPGYVGMND